MRWADRLEAGALVLDLAAGGGRHSRHLLSRGCRVVAVDRETAGLADLAGRAGMEIVAADLEAGPWPLPGRTFDAIVVTNYLWRPLLPTLCAALAPGGLLVYETFAVGNERFGKPANPHFLLRTGELLELARAHGLTVLAYEHGEDAVPKPGIRQRIAALREAA
ncbi:MAG: class I SAM-dependent methyltransferase [Alphaproteobacteria bacterium]|nr:class I SAM-dependent methyltransferase [Alphaproteobacteria bacterium]